MNQKGQRNFYHKLTDKEVMTIRKIWARNMTAKELAAKFNVAPITIYKVVTDQCWTHLPSVAEIRRKEGIRMSWADSRLEDDVRMYEMHTKMPDGTERVQYAYGAPWVAQALLMDDVKFDNPEDARKWWDRRYGS